MASWILIRLTEGTAKGVFHSHSYYDIPVIDASGSKVLVHRLGFTGRQPTAADAVNVGIASVEAPGTFETLGESRAWSWQQGPMAQWVGGGPLAVYNDREGEDFVARLVDTATGARRTLPRPVYAVSPDGRLALGLNMTRLDALRPGYGYAEGTGGHLGQRAPAGDGVWSIDPNTGVTRLVLSLAEARDFVLPRLGWSRRLRERLRPAHYWFNHAKFSPDGRRFTVKLRWRVPGRGWNDRQGVSLTATADGSDLRLIADATSHVLWLNDRQLYAWRLSELVLLEDREGPSNRVRRIAPNLVSENVHMRHLPPGPADVLGEAVFDTPYKEEVHLVLYDDRTGRHARIATFRGHVPARGPFRCDLHPVPSADGRTIVITSMDDGGRQVYALRRTGG